MSSQARRIDKLEFALTPRQAILLWLEESLRHDSLMAYARWLKEQPATAYPLVRLPRQVREAVRDGLKGARHDIIDAEIHRAERDVTFLYQLVWAANAEVCAEQRPAALGYLWLLERLRPPFPERRQAKAMATQWREQARLLAPETYALQGATAALSRRYFGGHPLLFPQQAATLQSLVGLWDSLFTLYHAWAEATLSGAVLRAVRVDPEEVQSWGLHRGKARADYLETLAKAETLRLVDRDYEGAALLVEPYL